MTEEKSENHNKSEPLIPQTIRTPVVLVDAQSPYPALAMYFLDSVPRPGDTILVGIRGVKTAYKVESILFDPFDEQTQIALFCRFASPESYRAVSEEITKKNMDKYIETQLKFQEKAKEYTNVVMALGYAGLFSLWSFAKPWLTPEASNLAIVLIGISLTMFVTWEIYLMLVRSWDENKFRAYIDKKPEKFFQAITARDKEKMKAASREAALWRWVFSGTVLSAYAAVLLLILNSFAGLLGFEPWP